MDPALQVLLITFSRRPGLVVHDRRDRQAIEWVK
jgi:hypothetical protein